MEQRSIGKKILYPISTKNNKMNRYHQNHPDPEIRQKYNDWPVAHANYVSRSRGFSSHDAELADQEKKKKQKAVMTVRQQLQMIGRAVAFNLKNPTVANDTKKRRRTAGRRGA